MQVFLLFILLHGIICIESGSNLIITYINNQAKIVSEKLNRHVRDQDISYATKLNVVNEVKLMGNYSTGEVFTFSNTSYAVMDRDLYQITGDNCSSMSTFLPTEEIIIFKTVQFRNLGFVVFATNFNVLYIFGYNIKTKIFFKIQNILHLNVTDAVFFQHEQNLHLVVASFKSYDLTTVVVYKFMDSHFDQTEQFFTSRATKLRTFSNNASEVILLLRKFGVTSSLYEYKHDKVKKIQKIDIQKPEDALSYTFLGKLYVVFFSKKKVSVYMWTGDELILENKFEIEFTLTGKKSIFYVNKNPYLLVNKGANFLVFGSINNQFLKIHDEIFNWTDIWTYDFVSQNVVIVLGKTTHNVEVRTVAISIEAPSEQNVEDGKLDVCFITLEKAIYFLRNKITKFENSSNTRRESNEASFLFQHWRNLQDKHSTTKAMAESLKSKNLVINGSAEVDMPNGAKKIIAKNIHFAKLNSQKWQPNRWLSYTLPQKISVPVKSQLVQSNVLHTTNNDSLFNDLLLSKGNHIISGSVTVNNMAANHVETKFLNTVPVENLYYKSQPVSIQGIKYFPELRAKNMNTASINGMDATQFLTVLTNPDSRTFTPNVTIDDLWVKTINGVNFDTFKNSVFRMGRTESIDGNLVFANLQAREMVFHTLSKKSKVLTTSTNQTIKSSIYIPKIFTNIVKSIKINGIDFKKSVATLDDSIIEGPVSIKKLNTRNNLELKGDINNEFLLLNDTHIVGTNESDFLQRYNGNVTIRGNLIVKNLDLGKNAKIFVDGKKFNTNLDQFWTKKTQQTIPDHFEVQNGVSTPHLFTKFLNGVNINDYLLNLTQQTKPTRFYFDSVLINGNVVLNPNEQHSPDLKQIQQNSVRVNGTFNIRGRKVYKNILKVDKLEIHQLLSGHTIGTLNDEIDDSGPETIHTLIIKGDLNAKNISVDRINNVSLIQLNENTIYIDQPQNLSKLSFQNATARDVSISSTLNEQKINEIMRKTANLYTVDKIDYVYVNGNVTMKNVERLLTINDQNISRLLQESHSYCKNDTIYGSTIFLRHVKIKDLHVITVNDVNLRNLSQRILYRSWNQPIKELFTFNKLITNNLITDKINDVPIKNIIDITDVEPQEIRAPDGLKMAAHIKIQNLDGQFPYDVHDSLNRFHSPPSQSWNRIRITENATFWDKQSFLSRIFDEVVTTAKDEQVIIGEITFANHISANNITALKNINGIDIMEIIQDAFLNRPGLEQVVAGMKTFTQIEAEDVISLQNTNVSAINNIIIAEIDSKIINKEAIPNVPIRGQKVFFGGLQTGKIETDMISGVEPRNLVSVEKSNKIVTAMFETLNVVDNLNIGYVNGMPFDVFLNERLQTDVSKQIVTGNYFFQDIRIYGNVTTPRVNDLPIENIIFDSGVQVMEASKKFSNDLKISGNVSAEIINGLKLSEVYEQAALKNEDSNFTQVQILKPVVMNGNICTKYINGVPVDYMLDTNSKYSLQVEAQQIHKITTIIANFVRKYLNTMIRMPTEILYLEKSSDLQIPFPNAVSANVFETNDDILIHVESEENGDYCGLPQMCKCPMQQTMQISLEHSFSVFMNKAMQRIYSYYNDDIIINVITHSVSTSSNCRTSTAKVLNEVSTLTWNVPPQKNNSGGFYIHRGFFNGYVTGVKFFTIYGRTYIVIAIYYDPVLNTHEVDTLIFRFNDDKTALEQIQKIPTVGMKTISLFPTAQGVILIMSGEFNSGTQILRFNQEKQQFEILREVPTYESLHAEGIVFALDNFIILANKRSNLLVLKYHSEFDNYYLYQTFRMDYPVSHMSVFYASDFGKSDAYLSVVTTKGKYFIYSYWFIEGWKLEFSGMLDGAKMLVPLNLNKRLYLLAPSRDVTSLLTAVEHDSD